MPVQLRSLSKVSSCRNSERPTNAVRIPSALPQPWQHPSSSPSACSQRGAPKPPLPRGKWGLLHKSPSSLTPWCPPSPSLGWEPLPRSPRSGWMRTPGTPLHRQPNPGQRRKPLVLCSPVLVNLRPEGQRPDLCGGGGKAPTGKQSKRHGICVKEPATGLR